MKSVFKRALLTSILVGAGFAALSQGMPGPMGGGPQAGMQQGMHRGDPARMQERIDKRLAALKAKLKITPEQESAWTTFTLSMKPPASMGQRPERDEWTKLSTPERIDKMRALRSVHQAEMDKIGDAVKAFYMTLTPEQKKTFDAQRMHGGHRGGMHGMEGFGPPQ